MQRKPRTNIVRYDLVVAQYTKISGQITDSANWEHTAAETLKIVCMTICHGHSDTTNCLISLDLFYKKDGWEVSQPANVATMFMDCQMSPHQKRAKSSCVVVEGITAPVVLLCWPYLARSNGHGAVSLAWSLPKPACLPMLFILQLSRTASTARPLRNK